LRALPFGDLRQSIASGILAPCGAAQCVLVCVALQFCCGCAPKGEGGQGVRMKGYSWVGLSVYLRCHQPLRLELLPREVREVIEAGSPRI
jgi:hypothetical protein